jgi:hypothetical protein
MPPTHASVVRYGSGAGAAGNGQPFSSASYRVASATGQNEHSTTSWRPSRTQRRWAPWAPRANPRSWGWARTDRGQTHCKKRGAPFDLDGAGVERKCAIEIDGALFNRLTETDPSRATSQKVLESGVASIAPKKVADPCRDAQQQLKAATNELARSQNALNHKRTLLLQARERAQKVEAAVVLAEQE